MLLGELAWGWYEVGTLLPREVDLAERFGISRGVARECLRALEERGVVSVRHGSGAIVTAVSEWDVWSEDVLLAVVSSPLASELLPVLLESWQVVEAEAAALAAARIDADGVVTLSSRLEELRDAAAAPGRRASELFGEADSAFHAAIGELSGNLWLAGAGARIDSALRWAGYPLSPAAYLRERALPDHVAVVEAIAAGDPDGARAAMSNHFGALQGVLLEHAQEISADA